MKMNQSKAAAAAAAAMEITTQLIQHNIRNTMEYLTPLLGMANAPMVTYLTENLWKTHIPKEIQDEIHTTSDIKSAIDIFWNHLNADKSGDCMTNDQFKHFRAFLRKNGEFHLDNLQDVWITPEQLKYSFNAQRSNPLPIHGFMSTKKNHEVYVTADVIANMCAQTNHRKSLNVIDAGDGKGYLSTRLSLEHKIKVLGVDCNPINVNGALVRLGKLEKAWPVNKAQAERLAASNDQPPEKQTRRKRREAAKQRLAAKQQGDGDTDNNQPTAIINENYKNAIHFITPQTDFIKLFNEHFNITSDEIPDFCLSGLHTCGNLAPSCLRIYGENHQIAAVCNIGCCYHLLNEQFSEFTYRSIRRERSPESIRREVCEPAAAEPLEKRYGFPISQYLIERREKLGRNARMLACQSIHRVIDRKELPNDHLFFRALLEVLIQRKCPEYLNRIEVGRLKQCHTFIEYVRKSTQRNPVLPFGDIDDTELCELHDEFRMDERFLDVYHLMRVSIAAIVENIILLDRFLYLKELETSNDASYLIRFFDPVVSPRCYGLVAMKNFPNV